MKRVGGNVDLVNWKLSAGWLASYGGLEMPLMMMYIAENWVNNKQNWVGGDGDETMVGYA